MKRPYIDANLASIIVCLYYRLNLKGGNPVHDEWEEEYGEEEHHYIPSSGPFRIQCAFCKGTGVDPPTMKYLAHKTCPVCKGEGVLEFEQDRSNYHTCHKCSGNGRDPDSKEIKPCPACSGKGIV